MSFFYLKKLFFLYLDINFKFLKLNFWYRFQKLPGFVEKAVFALKELDEPKAMLPLS